MLRPVFITVGTLALFLGLLGVVLPFLPTTPFVLVSAYCFSRSSSRLHNALINHRLFGPIIVDWNRGRVIRPPVKRFATVMLLLMVSCSTLITQPPLLVLLVIGVGVAAVLGFIWSCPGGPAHAASKQREVPCPSDDAGCLERVS